MREICVRTILTTVVTSTVSMELVKMASEHSPADVSQVLTYNIIDRFLLATVGLYCSADYVRYIF